MEGEGNALGGKCPPPRKKERSCLSYVLGEGEKRHKGIKRGKGSVDVPLSNKLEGGRLIFTGEGLLEFISHGHKKRFLKGLHSSRGGISCGMKKGGVGRVHSPLEGGERFNLPIGTTFGGREGGRGK